MATDLETMEARGATICYGGDRKTWNGYQSWSGSIEIQDNVLINMNF